MIPIYNTSWKERYFRAPELPYHLSRCPLLCCGEQLIVWNVDCCWLSWIVKWVLVAFLLSASPSSLSWSNSHVTVPVFFIISQNCVLLNSFQFVTYYFWCMVSSSMLFIFRVHLSFQVSCCFCHWHIPHICSTSCRFEVYSEESR